MGTAAGSLSGRPRRQVRGRRRRPRRARPGAGARRGVAVLRVTEESGVARCDALPLPHPPPSPNPHPLCHALALFLCQLHIYSEFLSLAARVLVEGAGARPRRLRTARRGGGGARALQGSRLLFWNRRCFRAGSVLPGRVLPDKQLWVLTPPELPEPHRGPDRRRKKAVRHLCRLGFAV
jgi:hypothetical protein